jgi:hypothetical protein
MLWEINDVLFNKNVFKAYSILNVTKGDPKNQFANCSIQLKTTKSTGRYFIVSEIINKFPCLLIPKFALTFSQVSYFEDILSIPYPSTISP